MAKAQEVYVFDEVTKDTWWTLVVGGVLTVIFGFVAVIWPGITVGVLALLFAVLLGVLGVIDIVRSVRAFKTGFLNGAMRAVLGVLELGVSIFLLNRVGTGIAVATLGLVIALSLIVRGVVGVVLAFDKEASSGVRWLDGLVGGAAIIAGLVIVWYPVKGAIAWVWVLGLFALVAGAIEIATGFMARDALNGKK
jgi:uncharacterized membrane protein HdeD (DUF308 family)